MPYELCTLEQLRDHAVANANQEYDLGSCSSCLAAEATGRWMWNHHHFNVQFDVAPVLAKDEHATVPEAFAKMCDARKSSRLFTGLELAAAIDRLMAGDHPDQVAAELLS